MATKLTVRKIEHMFNKSDSPTGSEHSRRVIGVDPGARTGICVLGPDGVEEVLTMAHDKARYWISNAVRDAGELWVAAVEFSPSTHIYRRPGCSQRAMLKIAQNVERNRGYAREIIATLEALGVKVVKLAPRNTKMDPAWFAEETGWAGRTSSHARDAYVAASRVYQTGGPE